LTQFYEFIDNGFSPRIPAPNPNKLPMKSLEQLARSFEVGLSEVSKVAKELSLVSPAQARDKKYTLNSHQCATIRQELVRKGFIEEPPIGDSKTEAKKEPKKEHKAQPEVPLAPDPCANWEDLEFGALQYPLWAPLDLGKTLEKEKHLQKKVIIVLQHLGAHGKHSTTKGCAGNNRGWKRTPLGGGSNGMQHYLWWATQGSPPVKHLSLEKSEIVVGAVRKHEDHSPLSVRNLDEHFPLRSEDIEKENSLKLESPWTPDQLKFVHADAPVRIVVGLPGSGKTTVLQKAVEARKGQRVLYITWSRELTRQAEERFKSFAPQDVEVETLDFATFLNEVTGETLARLPLRESRRLFNESISALSSECLGAWATRKQALFAEIRAVLLGRATFHERCQPEGGVLRLSEKRYLDQRGKEKGVGLRHAKSLLSVFKAIEKSELKKIFPELEAATQATRLLRENDLTGSLLDFDRIVLDEAQDLTLLESEVIVELCRAIAKPRDHAPWLLIAGDHGQTVRPSGFEWGKMKDLLSTRLRKPEEFILDENLRCPERIAQVVDRAKKHYGNLHKEIRPTKQNQRGGSQHVDAYLFHLSVGDGSEATKLLKKIDDSVGVAVISSQEEIPKWASEEIKDIILSPADTKGLEYQSVCLLNPGSTLAGLKPKAGGDGKGKEINAHMRRTMIDRLRVALSRATETLAFIDVEADDEHEALSKDLLSKDFIPAEPDDLVDHFQTADASPEERVGARTEEARQLQDDNPRQALKKAYQAMKLLGNPNLPNGVSDQAVRIETFETVRDVGTRAMVNLFTTDEKLAKEHVRWIHEAIESIDPTDEKFATEPSRWIDKEIESIGTKKEGNLSSGTQLDAFRALYNWLMDKKSSVIPLLESVDSLGTDGKWLVDELRPITPDLKKKLEDDATDSRFAESFKGNVEGWLKITESLARDPKSIAQKLRKKAFDTMLEHRDLVAAESILSRLHPEDHLRVGKLKEAQELWEDAAKAFEKAKSFANAYRNWRSSGKWKEAFRLAKGDEKAELRWMMDVEAMLGKPPKKLGESITEKERMRLNKLLEDARR
jgi:hypothetical protein